MLLNDVKWEKPVTISLENGAPRIFNGVYEAFDFYSTNGRNAVAKRMNRPCACAVPR